VDVLGATVSGATVLDVGGAVVTTMLVEPSTVEGSEAVPPDAEPEHAVPAASAVTLTVNIQARRPIRRQRYPPTTVAPMARGGTSQRSAMLATKA
jgi:hypothetical protein